MEREREDRKQRERIDGERDLGSSEACAASSRKLFQHQKMQSRWRMSLYPEALEPLNGKAPEIWTLKP